MAALFYCVLLIILHECYAFNLLSNCTEYYFSQYLDHYNYRAPPFPYNDYTTYQQRYFVCGGSNWSANGTIFFYAGNEANIELYINNTGIMWENADNFNAIMVFAEHRYWGKSIPFDNNKEAIYTDPILLSYISPDQAIADYAALLYDLKKTWNSWLSPVIGFGGSYGAMLCYWLKLKFPQSLSGCLAGSAPILGFMGEKPAINPFYYTETQTFDASTAGGSNDLCKDNIHSSWSVIFEWAKSETGRINLKNALRLCRTPIDENEVNLTVGWFKSSMNPMAMGSYPYPSSYMLGGQGFMPPFPLRVGCEFMTKDFGNNSFAKLNALTELIGIYRNFSNNTECYQVLEPTSSIIDINQLFLFDHWTSYVWDYMYCTGDLLIIHGKSGMVDMFWFEPWNATEQALRCYDRYHIKTRIYQNEINYGGKLSLIHQNSVKNVIFSNGILDPWNNGGIHFNNTDNGIYSISTGMVGHHMDMMFSNNNDPQSVINAREFEIQQFKIWIDQHQKKHKNKC